MKKKKSLLTLLVTAITAASLVTATSTGSFVAAAKTTTGATLSNTPLYSFSVISDCHVNTNDTDRNVNFTNALQCIKYKFGGDSCIVMNGDVVDDNSEYDTLGKLISSANSGKKLPYIYFNYGNHEFDDQPDGSPHVENYNRSLNTFITETNRIQTNYLNHSDAVRDAGNSYDWKYVKGNLFFFLGTDKLAYDQQINCADLDRNYQLSHLFSKLNSTSGWKFVFCHQPPHGTVQGSDWTNCICERSYDDPNGDYFENNIKQYNKTLMFTSHTHRDFNQYKNTSDGYKDAFGGHNDDFYQLGGCSVFNTSSVRYCAQGLHVIVYSDHVHVDGVQYKSPTSVSFVSKRDVLN